MFEYNFPMVSSTSTGLLITPNYNDPFASTILVGLRGANNEACPNMWCIPGGFLNGKYTPEKAKYPGESAKAALIREIKEETGLVMKEENFHLFYEISDPDHDPRPAQVIGLNYYAEITEEFEDQVPTAGDDLKELKSIPYNELSKMPLAFNHNDILERGFNAWYTEFKSRIFTPSRGNMPGKRTALGLFRVQPVHKGHTRIISSMIEDFDTVIVGLGSASISGTEHDPWNVTQRELMLRRIYGDRIHIIPIEDIGAEAHENSWVEHVLSEVKEAGLPIPTDYFTGSTADSIWYKNLFWGGMVSDPAIQTSHYVDVDGEKVLRRLHLKDRANHTFIISASDIRGFLKNGNRAWKEFVPAVNHNFVEETYVKTLK